MAEIQRRVSVYQDESRGRIVSRVRYNSNLDFWNGRNWTCGSTGRHKGLTKLRDGQYVLIHGTDWQGERDWAVVVSPDQALQEILQHNAGELLKTKKFRELRELYEAMESEEEDDD